MVSLIKFSNIRSFQYDNFFCIEFQKCFYCKSNGASIGCCVRTCRKSFHLSCGLQNSCTNEFIGNHQSFCHLHFNINTQNTSLTHDESVMCSICQLTMGEYHKTSSMQTVCCESNEWFHKKCLKERAYKLEDDFCCPSCGDFDNFRENMLFNSVFIPKSNPLAQYRSFHDDHNSEMEPAQKKRRVRKDWILETTFTCKKEAEQFIKDGNWGYFYENKSNDGVSITYRCKHVKFRGAQCAAGVRLVFDSRSHNIQLFRADAAHSHTNSSNAVESIPDDIQDEIKRLYENNVTKPKAVQTNLLKKGFDVPPIQKLKTLLKKLNEARYGQDKIHFGTLEKWLQENTPLPESETEPFVLNYEMDYENEAQIDFRFLVTTKLLLKHAVGSENFHADATYKIVWQGFPMLVVGVTDQCRAFHPVAVAVCISEAEKDFEFIFSAVKQGLNKIFDVNFEPKYVIADAAFSIANAAKKVFGLDVLIIMCWFHMRRAVSDKLPSFIKDIKKQAKCLSDLDHLQVAKTPEIFEKALQLFMDKWRDESEDLIEYFEREWVAKCPNWYESFAPLVPSTNNALESNNRLIKDEHTFRERMDLGKFRITLFEMIQTWSIRYSGGVKVTNPDAPEIELELWTAGYQLAKSNTKMTSSRGNNNITFRSVTTEKVDDSTNWTNFDDFKKNSFGFHDTTFIYPARRENWLRSKCDCSDFFKKYMCAHIIAIAIRLKCVQPPAEAKTVPIGQKRKRGRPQKAKSALTRQ